MSWSRVEHDALTLDVIEGALPSDLDGSYYFMTPAAHPGMGDEGCSAEWADRGSVINGDGMVVRVDLSTVGKAVVSSKLVKTLDYWADVVTATNPDLSWARFHDLGMMRASPLLGARDFANTALLPLPFADGPTRLLCCYDAGRPVEIDPVTLDTVGPVGSTKAWTAEALGFLPFPPILSTAHPFFDPSTGEAWMVNYGRSARSMLSSVPWSADLGKFMRWLFGRLLAPIAEWIADEVADDVSWFEGLLRRALVGKSEAERQALLDAFAAEHRTSTREAEDATDGGLLPSDFLHLMRWTGTGDVQSIRLVDEDGNDLKVEQSLHQIAATRHWIVIMDTCFDLRIEQFYSDPAPKDPRLERLLRELTASPQLNYSNLWFVRRSDVEAAIAGGTGTAKASHVRLPLGSVHFLADFDDRVDGDEVITMHVAHGVSLDIAEWVRAFDQLRTREGDRAVVELQGMIASAVDQSRIGRWQIRPTDGAILSSSLVADDTTWGIALYAGHQVPNWGPPMEKFQETFWFTSGLWPDLMTDFIWRLYADQPDRLVPLERVDQLLRSGGTPSYLMRVATDPLAIVDRYAYPADTTPSSPQFIPSTKGGAGYLVTTVWTPTRGELWFFRADALQDGPIAKLASNQLCFGFSMHACWLPDPKPTDGARLDEAAFAGADDEAALLARATRDPKVAELVRNHILPAAHEARKSGSGKSA
jgi:hypothetical protein